MGVVCSGAVRAERHAMIISLRAGEPQQSNLNREYCLQTKALFELAGMDKIMLFSAGGSEVLEGSEVASGTVLLEQLKQEAEELDQGDEFWLVLYGYVSSSSRGVMLVTPGKRLPVELLAEALDAIDAWQCVLVLTQNSAALMNPLGTRSDRCILTATSSPNQINPPLLPESLFSAWKADLSADCRAVFNQAAQQMEFIYQSRGIAVSEVAQLFDGSQIDVFPFETEESSRKWSLNGNEISTEREQKAVTLATPEASETNNLERLKRVDFSEFDALRMGALKKELQPATDVTLQMIKEAKELSLSHQGFSAFAPWVQHRILINADRSTLREKSSKIYLINDVATETYGHIFLEDKPLRQTLQIKTARIIYPDGRFLSVTPKISNSTEGSTRYLELKFPGAKAGCLIDLVLKETAVADSALPFFNENLVLQQSIPVNTVQVELEYPQTCTLYYKLYGTVEIPTETENGQCRKLTLQLDNIPALEALPNDPPINDMAVRMALSTLDSWDSFRQWTDRMLEGCDVVDDATRKHAESLTLQAKTEAEKVKALYEFLCNLRYETTPIGALAFRPRLPGEVCTSFYGDCKDKANALVAMARSLGITGYVALVNRTSSTDQAFPAWQFNHAVAFFPELSEFPEGLWCDATDGSTPFTSLPPGDIGRGALVLMDKSTDFKTIQLPISSLNSIKQSWELEVSPSNTVTGTICYTAHGLSDYYLRQSLKDASPKQLEYSIQSMLNRRVTGLCIEQIKTSSLSDLSIPLSITLECSGADWPLVRASLTAPFDLWNAVAVPQRDRDLLLNDGQPLSVTQRIHVTGDLIHPTPSQWVNETEVAEMSVYLSVDHQEWERHSHITLTQPRVSPESYPVFRAQVSDWNAALKHCLIENIQGTE